MTEVNKPDNRIPRRTFLHGAVALVGGATALGTPSPRAAAAPGLAHPPSLWFDEAGREAIRARLDKPDVADIWKAFHTSARNMSNPKMPDYVELSDAANKLAKGFDGLSESEKSAQAALLGRHWQGWLETLGFVYQMTGDTTIGKHGAALLYQAVQYLSLGTSPAKDAGVGGRGDITFGLAVGLDWLSSELDSEQKDSVISAATSYVDVGFAEASDTKKGWHTYHNFMGVAVGALGCLALALDSHKVVGMASIAEDCESLSELWMDQGIDGQGANYEGVNYLAYGATNHSKFSAALIQRGRSGLLGGKNARGIPQYLAHSLLPAEPIYEARNDSNYRGYSATAIGPALLMMAREQSSGVARWLHDYTYQRGLSVFEILWSQTVVATPPTATNVKLAEHFTGRGLCSFRTGWGEQDVLFSIEAGIYNPITHNQADKGHFGLYGYGQKWATDPGYANNEDPNGRGQAVAHNGVLVDGVGQQLSGAGLGTDGEILSFEDNVTFGFVSLDSTAAYRQSVAYPRGGDKNPPGVAFEYAFRQSLFVRPSHGALPYVVIADNVRKDGENREYRWQMLTDPALQVSIDKDGVTNRATISGAATEGRAYVGTLTSDPVSSGTVTFTFDVVAAGSFTLWARVRTRAEPSTKSDSLYVTLGSGLRVDWHTRATDQWRWTPFTVGTSQNNTVWDLAAGSHIVVLGGREPGCEIATVAMVPQGAAPTDANPSFQLVPAEFGSCVPPMRVFRDGPQPPARLLAALAGDEMSWGGGFHEEFPLLSVDHGTRAFSVGAILIPLPSGAPEPTVTTKVNESSLTAEVAWAGRTDSINVRWQRTPVVNRPLVRLMPR